jgi:hypothetical protein
MRLNTLVLEYEGLIAQIKVWSMINDFVVFFFFAIRIVWIWYMFESQRITSCL